MCARTILLVATLTAAPATVQVQRGSSETGITGSVHAPDGKPVASGTVVLQAPLRRVSAGIDETGHFRVAPETQGPHQLLIISPDFAPVHVLIDVPASRNVKLPPVRLLPPTYFRVRLASAEGEAILAARLRRLTIDEDNADRPGGDLTGRFEVDGSLLTAGPLPLGKTLLAVDAPPFALTRLSDVEVGANGGLLDGGTVVLQRGALLHVDIVDSAGNAVANHDVSIEDARTPSPLDGRLGRTNNTGVVTFDRLSAGSYRVRTSVAERCSGQRLTFARIVSVPGAGALGTRLVVGGALKLRVSSPLGPLGGAAISAAPDAGTSALSSDPRALPPGVMRPALPLGMETWCSGTTDVDGRVTLANFPPGPARVDIRFPNSTDSRRISVPEKDAEVALEIADGVAPVRVVHAESRQPLANAAIVWSGGGARVAARTLATGDALLEYSGAGPGTLEASADGYETVSVKLAAPPADAYEVALAPRPPTSVEVHVINAAGQPVANAIVGLVARSRPDRMLISVTDATGVARFAAAPRGAAHVIAAVDGVVSAERQMSAATRGDIVLTLSSPR